jgi:hypothetical protein
MLFFSFKNCYNCVTCVGNGCSALSSRITDRRGRVFFGLLEGACRRSSDYSQTGNEVGQINNVVSILCPPLKDIPK